MLEIWLVDHENDDFTYWLIQLGKLYYAGGLARVSPFKDTSSYEFVNKESLAFPIVIEDIAKRLAEEFGAEIVTKNVTFGEYAALHERNGKYINSEKDWLEEQHKDAEVLKDQ